MHEYVYICVFINGSRVSEYKKCLSNLLLKGVLLGLKFAFPTATNLSTALISLKKLIAISNIPPYNIAARKSFLQKTCHIPSWLSR